MQILQTKDQHKPNEQSTDQTVFYKTQEVLKHNKKDDCWVIIDNKIYDLSLWINRHPGGDLTILSVAGKDCSQIFDVYHPESVRKMLTNFYVGSIDPLTIKQNYLESDFKKLHSEIKEQGLYNTDYSYYIMKTLVSLALFSLVWVLVYFGQQYQSYLMQTLGFITLGIFFQQTAFLGHDAGHTGITHNRLFDSLYGIIVGNLITGISIGWWKDSHNTHHVVPNSLQYDPDIQHLPFMAVSNKYFNSVYSFYHNKIMSFDHFSRFLCSYQHILFYPVMSVARFFLYVQSLLMIANLKQRKCEWQSFELMSWLGFFLWMRYLFSFAMDGKMAIFGLFLSHGIAGMLHVQIVLSHFSMEIFDEKSKIYEEQSFVLVQQKSSLDIQNPKWMDWFHGGLQYQLAHHCFPRIPRHNLHIIRKKLGDLLEKHGIKYNITGFIDANRRTIQTMKNTALEAQKYQFKNTFSQSFLWESINARG